MIKNLVYLGSLSKKLWFIVLSIVLFYIEFLLNILFSNLFNNKFPTIFIFFSRFIGNIISLPVYYFYRWKNQQKPLFKDILLNDKPILTKLIVIGIIFLYICFKIMLDLCFIETEYPINIQYNNIFSFLSILIIAGLCFIILKYQYHRHHLLSIGLIFLGLVIQMVLAPINKILINHLIYFILYTILDGFREVLPKYLMEKKYVEPLILIFYEGVI